MKLRKLFNRRIITAVCLILLATPGFSQKKYDKFLKDECLPADVKKSGYVLIVINPYKSSFSDKNEKIQKLFEANYNGKVVFLDWGENSQEKYKDSKVYRYTVNILSSYDGPHQHFSITLTDNSKGDKEGFVSCRIEAPERKLDELVTYYAKKINGE